MSTLLSGVVTIGFLVFMAAAFLMVYLLSVFIIACIDWVKGR